MTMNPELRCFLSALQITDLHLSLGRCRQIRKIWKSRKSTAEPLALASHIDTSESNVGRGYKFLSDTSFWLFPTQYPELVAQS